MTAPSYTTNLSLLTEAESNTNWYEFTGLSYDAHGSPQGADADWPFIQNTYAVTQVCSAAKGGIASMGYDNTSSIGGHGTDGAYLVWQLFANPNYVSYANGGLRVVIGDGLASFYSWDVGGNDVGVATYLGWQNHAVNTTVSPDDSVGTYAGTGETIVGAAVDTGSVGIAKGEPHCIDVIRYGRCDAVFQYGETADYATIAGFAAVNDAVNNRYGLIQEIAGGYLWKGLMQLGGAAAVDFRDQDVNIFIQWTPKVTANFNTIEIVHASSNVEMTNFQFICLDTSTASKGRWITTNDATVSLDSCRFVDMATFSFGSNTTATGCVFVRCGQITTNGAGLPGSTITGCTVDGSSSNEAAVIWDVATDPDGYLDGLTITKGTTTHHAIEFGDTIPSSVTLRNCTFSGYHADDDEYDSTFYFADTTGTITLNLVSCSGNVSVETAGCSVTVVEDPVTVKVTVKTAAGVVVENARVFVKASDGTGPFPFEEVVTSITNSGTTATVAHTGHGMDTNDYVDIKGASLEANNGVFQITVNGVDEYEYTMSSSPGSSPTGTITSTFVALYGLTSALGVVSTSRVYSSDQNVEGWARKGSSSPYYKTGSISDTVDSSDGLNYTAVLITDG